MRIARSFPHGFAQRSQVTLEHVATANLGAASGKRDPPRHQILDVLRFVLLWDLAIAHTHNSVDLREFAAFWGEPVRTAYRWQATFRAAFPGEETPTRLLAVCRGYERSGGVEALAATKVHVALTQESADATVAAARRRR